MYTLTLNHVVILSLLLHRSYCQRRIVNGDLVTVPKRYVVYLTEAHISPMDYDEWMCGGALVSPLFIITSAACIEDVKHMYAIAGYDKYISKENIYTNPCTSKIKKKIILTCVPKSCIEDVKHMYAIAGYDKYISKENIYTDPCTSKIKKKIILTCVPKSYELEYSKLEKWSFIDIGVAKVESPYNLDGDDTEYTQMGCSYRPKKIEINFEIKYQNPGVDAIALGWGHKIKWRSDGDDKTYNNEQLQYTSVLLADKEKCKKEYQNYTGMPKVIDTYMICSIEAGNMDEVGALKVKSKPTANGCPGFDEKLVKLMEVEGKACDPAEETEDTSWLEYTRRRNSDNDTVNDHNIFNSTDNHENKTVPILNTRRNGICQNDHGGPIVTWIGGSEFLIGVASVFKVSKDMECSPPFLYTSTECNGAFLACVLDIQDTARRAICDAPPSVKGYDTLETHISWKFHPDGVAENERVNETLINGTSYSIRSSDSKPVNSSLINMLTTLAAKRTKQETEIRSRSSDNEQVNLSLTNTTTSTVSTTKVMQGTEIRSRSSDNEQVNLSLTNATTSSASTIKLTQGTESRLSSSERVNVSLQTVSTSFYTKKL